MPVSHDTINTVESSIAAGSVLIAALSHWAAISTHDERVSKGVLAGNLFGAGLAGLGVFYIIDDILPWKVSFMGSLFFSGLVGFVWGPLFLFLLARVGQGELAKRLHLDKSALLPVPDGKSYTSGNSSNSNEVSKETIEIIPVVEKKPEELNIPKSVTSDKVDVVKGGEGDASATNGLDNPLG